MLRMRMLDSVFNKENLVKIRCIMLVMMIHQLFMMILWIISWKCRWWWWGDGCWSSGGGGWRHQLWSVSCSPAPLAHVSHGLPWSPLLPPLTWSQPPPVHEKCPQSRHQSVNSYHTEISHTERNSPFFSLLTLLLQLQLNLT